MRHHFYLWEYLNSMSTTNRKLIPCYPSMLQMWTRRDVDAYDDARWRDGLVNTVRSRLVSCRGRTVALHSSTSLMTTSTIVLFTSFLSFVFAISCVRSSSCCWRWQLLCFVFVCLVLDYRVCQSCVSNVVCVRLIFVYSAKCKPHNNTSYL